jgi:hypothetical protein
MRMQDVAPEGMQSCYITFIIACVERDPNIIKANAEL